MYTTYMHTYYTHMHVHTTSMGMQGLLLLCNVMPWLSSEQVLFIVWQHAFMLVFVSSCAAAIARTHVSAHVLMPVWFAFRAAALPDPLAAAATTPSRLPCLACLPACLNE